MSEHPPIELPEELRDLLDKLPDRDAGTELSGQLVGLDFDRGWHVFDRLVAARRFDVRVVRGAIGSSSRYRPLLFVYLLAADLPDLRADLEELAPPRTGSAAMDVLLHRLGARPILRSSEWLEPLETHADDATRALVVRLAGRHRDAIAGCIVRRRLEADRSASVVIAAALAADLPDRVGGEGPEAALIHLVREGEVSWSTAAASALARLDLTGGASAVLDRLWGLYGADLDGADDRLTALIPAVTDAAEIGAPEALAWLLGHRADPQTLAPLLALTRSEEPLVRSEALLGLARRAPDLAAGAAVRMLGDHDAHNRRQAEDILALAARPELTEGLLALALGDEDRSARAAVRVLSNWPTLRAGAATLFALMSLDDPVREAAEAAVAESPRIGALAAVEEAGVDLVGAALDAPRWERDDRVAALLAEEALRDHTLAICEGAIESENWSVRQNAAQAMAAQPGPRTVGQLRILCDDDDEDVRREALKGYARCDDGGVVAMVLTALSDEDEDVRNAAGEILDEPSAHPRLASLEQRYGEGTCALQRSRLDAVLEWGQRAAEVFLRQHVEIVGWRGGAGRTHFARKGRDAVRIEVNVSPLFEAGPLGEDVVRGVIVHELGHHAYDFRAPGFKSASGVARGRGAGPLWNIMLDERLERRVRSERPLWGPLIDRMNAWLIQARPQRVAMTLLAEASGIELGELASRIASGDLPGSLLGQDDGAPGDRQVLLGPWDAVSIPGLLPPLHSFFLGLMAVRDHERIADPGAREALALIPPDLKDMPHGPLARLTLQIADLLGVDDGGRAQRRRFARLMGRYGSIVGGVGGLVGRSQQARPTGTWTAASAAREISSRLKGRAGPVLRQAPTPARLHPKPRKERGIPSAMLNLGGELEFPDLRYEETLPVQAAGLARLRAEVRPHVRLLRGHFERLGRTLAEHHASRRGRRLDMARVKDLALLGRPDALVHSEEVLAPDAYLGLLIDRSGSMAIGDRMPLARKFGVLLAEAARGLRGIEGHISAFDGSTFYRLGDFQRHAIAGLTADDGNNDSGALLRAAQLALASRRQNRLIVMISDGSPAECSVASLRNLVGVLEKRYGIACAQVAVAPLSEICFPHFLDVSSKPTREAVRQFARLLVRLTRAWR